MDKKAKILIVHNYYQIPGGEDSVVANEKELLENKGHKVFLYKRENNELKTMSLLRKLFLPFTTIFSLKTYSEVKKIIKEQNIDIVHVHNTLNLVSPAVYYAAFFCKVPVVQTIHNFRLLCPAGTFYRDGKVCEDCVISGLKCAVKHNCYRGSKLQTLGLVFSTTIHRIIGTYGKLNYICLTDFNKKKLLELKQISPSKVFVKPNFVNEMRIPVPQEQRKNQFVFAGRLDELKGIDMLLKAWKQLGQDAPDLIVCGTGPMEKWCREYINSNNIKNIKLMGFVPNKQVFDIISNSKALILPTQWYEGFPMTIVESYATGTPVIASNIGNVGSIVASSSGYTFSHNSIDDLVSTITRFLDNEVIVDKDVMEQYSKENNYNMLMHAYSRVR